jgi:hypothetical protein
MTWEGTSAAAQALILMRMGTSPIGIRISTMRRDAALPNRHGRALTRPSCVRKLFCPGGESPTQVNLPNLKPEVTACVARPRGEQPEANEQSVELQTRFGRAVWRACDGMAKPKPASQRDAQDAEK